MLDGGARTRRASPRRRPRRRFRVVSPSHNKKKQKEKDAECEAIALPLEASKFVKMRELKRENRVPLAWFVENLPGLGY